MGDVTTICDVCEEEISFRKYEDTAAAYARHSQSDYHLEIEKRFRSIKLGDGDAACSKEFVSSSRNVNGEAESQPSLPTNLSHAKSVPVFSCKLCQVEVVDSLAMMSHIQSEKHTKMESFVKNVNGQRQTLLQGSDHIKWILDDVWNRYDLQEKMIRINKIEIANLRANIDEMMAESKSGVAVSNFHVLPNNLVPTNSQEPYNPYFQPNIEIETANAKSSITESNKVHGVYDEIATASPSLHNMVVESTMLESKGYVWSMEHLPDDEEKYFHSGGTSEDELEHHLRRSLVHFPHHTEKVQSPFEIMLNFEDEIIVRWMIDDVEDECFDIPIHLCAKTQKNRIGEDIVYLFDPSSRGHFENPCSHNDVVNNERVYFRDITQWMMLTFRTNQIKCHESFFVVPESAKSFFSSMRVQLGCEFIKKYVSHIDPESQRISISANGITESLEFKWRMSESIPDYETIETIA